MNENRAPVMGGFAALKKREFAYYLSARFLSAIAAQMVIVAVGWQVYHITGRMLDLGLIGLSQFLPFLCLALYAGHVADRRDRGFIVMSCLVVFLFSALLLVWLAARGLNTILPIFGVLGILGIARAFLTPAAQSLVPNLVPAEALSNAVALSSTSFQVATIAGPSVGGLIYALGETSRGLAGGAVWVYGAAGVMFLAAILLLAQVKEPSSHRAKGIASVGAALEGLRFVWRRKMVLGAISLDLFAVLFGGATALLPAFTQDVLHQGPQAYGYLRAAPGVGAGVCALWLAFRPITQHVGAWMFSGVAVFGVATLVFGLTRHFPVAMIALMVLGAGDMVSVFIRQLLVQLTTPDAIRGRVSAVNSVFIGASNELGEFESGFTAAWLGLVPAIVLGGAATLLVTAVWAGLLFPRLGRLRTFEQLRDGHVHET